MQTSVNPRVPHWEPRRITLEQYEAFTPEKLELIEGFLIDGPKYNEERRALLRLLLVNEGLDAAVAWPRTLAGSRR